MFIDIYFFIIEYLGRIKVFASMNTATINILLITFYFIYTLFFQERENNLYVDQKTITSKSVVIITVLLSKITTGPPG